MTGININFQKSKPRIKTYKLRKMIDDLIIYSKYSNSYPCEIYDSIFRYLQQALSDKVVLGELKEEVDNHCELNK